MSGFLLELFGKSSGSTGGGRGRRMVQGTICYLSGGCPVRYGVPLDSL